MLYPQVKCKWWNPQQNGRFFYTVSLKAEHKLQMQ